MLFDQSIPIPMEDDLVHTDHDPFCSDPTCPCHEECENIDAVAEMVQGGLLTPDEAEMLSRSPTRWRQGAPRH